MEQFLIKARKNDFTTCSFDSFSSFKFIFIGLLLIPHEADGLHRRLVLDPPQSLPIRCAIHILPLLSPGWGKIKSNWCRLNNSAQVFVTRPHFVSAPGELVHSVARPRFIINSSSSSLIWNPSLRAGDADLVALAREFLREPLVATKGSCSLWPRFKWTPSAWGRKVI